MRHTLHEHSTVAAGIASVILGVLVGVATHWSAIAIVLTMIAAFLVLPRIFFGLRASRVIDKEKGQEDTGPTILSGFDMAGLDSEPQRLERAYSRATDQIDPDPSELRELAEEER